MMKIQFVFALVLLVSSAGQLCGQTRESPPPGGFAPVVMSPEDSLRTMITERFARQVQEQLGLTRDQTERMRGTVLGWFARRRNLLFRERQIKQALAGQMRPGMAADQDSVSRLMDDLLALKVQQAQTYRDELHDMSYLTPVQRAQFFIMRERLLEAIQNAQEDTTGRPIRRRPRP